MATKVIVNVLLRSKQEVGLVEYEAMPDSQQGLMIASNVVPEGGDLEFAVREIAELHFDGLSAGDAKLYAAELFIGHDGTWHVAISYLIDSEKEAVRHKAAVKALKWVPSDKLSNEKIAHSGWTKSLIARALKIA